MFFGRRSADAHLFNMSGDDVVLLRALKRRLEK